MVDPPRKLSAAAAPVWCVFDVHGDRERERIRLARPVGRGLTAGTLLPAGLPRFYAAGEARRRLAALGQTDDQIYTLDGDWKDYTAAERAAFALAKKLAASPVVLTDDDVADAVKRLGARDTVQLIHYVTTRASFDRITEAAGLRLDE